MEVLFIINAPAQLYQILFSLIVNNNSVNIFPYDHQRPVLVQSANDCCWGLHSKPTEAQTQLSNLQWLFFSIGWRRPTTLTEWTEDTDRPPLFLQHMHMFLSLTQTVFVFFFVSECYTSGGEVVTLAITWSDLDDYRFFFYSLCCWWFICDLSLPVSSRAIYNRQSNKH